MSGRSRYPLFLGLVLAVGAVGMVAAAVLPSLPEVRKGCLMGAGLASFSGLVSLELKRRAMARALKGAMVAVAVVFLLRLFLVGVGFVVAARVVGVPGMAFILGFFGEYFALQWIELGYVLVESKRRDPGGV